MMDLQPRCRIINPLQAPTEDSYQRQVCAHIPFYFPELTCFTLTIGPNDSGASDTGIAGPPNVVNQPSAQPVHINVDPETSNVAVQDQGPNAMGHNSTPNDVRMAGMGDVVLDHSHILPHTVAQTDNGLHAPYGNGDTLEGRVRFEASKIPLDVAVFNSIRISESPFNVPLVTSAQLGVVAATDKIKKFLQVVLVVGGTALTPGIIQALESR